MPFSILSIFGFFFPTAIFAAGALLIYRTYSSRNKVTGGTVKSEKPFMSIISGTPSAYCRVSVEYFAGGHEPWVRAFEYTLTSQMSIGKLEISNQDSGKALYEVGLCSEFRGRAGETYRGTIGAFVDSMKSATVGNLAMTVMDSAGLRSKEEFALENERIPDYVLGKILPLPGGNSVRKFLDRQLRVREYSLPQGAQASVAKDDRIFTSSYIITDGPEEKLESSLRERSLLRYGLGAALLLVSLIISVFILLSILS